MSGEMMTFPSKWEQFLHDYEFEDARRVYTNGSRLIPSFRVKQMMEHYAPSVEQTGWYGVVRWCAEDVIAAAEQNGVTLTEAQAEKWLEKNERWFKEMLTEYGNEVLASASKESFEEVCKAVSYTHLDVYKRQEYILPILTGLEVQKLRQRLATAGVPIR